MTSNTNGHSAQDEERALQSLVAVELSDIKLTVASILKLLDTHLPVIAKALTKEQT